MKRWEHRAAASMGFLLLAPAVAAGPPAPRSTPTPSTVAPKAAVSSTPSDAASVPALLSKPDLRLELVKKQNILVLRVVNAGNAATKVPTQISFECAEKPPAQQPAYSELFPGCSLFQPGAGGIYPYVVPALAKGASHDFGLPKFVPGKFQKVKAKVDPQNAIAEKDETNNTLDLLDPI